MSSQMDLRIVYQHAKFSVYQNVKSSELAGHVWLSECQI